TRHLRLREFLVGVEGVALMRHVFEDDTSAEARINEIRDIVCGGDEVYDLGVDVSEADARAGYARWSGTYDNPGNPLISVEQPVVWTLIAAWRPATPWMRRAGLAVTPAASSISTIASL